jgi:hypothetical protein
MTKFQRLFLFILWICFLSGIVYFATQARADCTPVFVCDEHGKCHWETHCEP